MSHMIRCAHCRRLFRPNPRVKNQRYCSEKSCQRTRKNRWQREKMATDADYQANQRHCLKSWRKRNRHYWRQYRSRHPEAVERNRLAQRLRNRRRGLFQRIAKMDASKQLYSEKAKSYYLIPQIAKMDALAQKVLLIPAA